MSGVEEDLVDNVVYRSAGMIYCDYTQVLAHKRVSEGNAACRRNSTRLAEVVIRINVVNVERSTK